MNEPALITVPHTGTIFTVELLHQHWTSTQVRATKEGQFVFAHVDAVWRCTRDLAFSQGRKLVTTYRDPLETLASWKNRDQKISLTGFLYAWDKWTTEIAPHAYIFEPCDEERREESLKGLERYLGVELDTDWKPENTSGDRLGLKAALRSCSSLDEKCQVLMDCGVFPQPMFIREVARYGRY